MQSGALSCANFVPHSASTREDARLGTCPAKAACVPRDTRGRQAAYGAKPPFGGGLAGPMGPNRAGLEFARTDIQPIRICRSGTMLFCINDMSNFKY